MAFRIPKALRSRRFVVLATLALLAGGAAVAHTSLLRWALNSFVLADSGARIVSAETLSIDPVAALQGDLLVAGRELRLQHALMPETMAIARFDGRASLDGKAVVASFRIGAHDGRLRIDRVDDEVRSAELVIGDGQPSTLTAHLKRAPGGTPLVTIRGRHSATILAALLSRGPAEMASLPERIDLDLSMGSGNRLLLRYHLVGPALWMSGGGEVGLATRVVRHEGQLRLARDDRAATGENVYAAVQTGLSMVADKAVPLLHRYKVSSRLDVTLVRAGTQARYRVDLASDGKSAGSAARLLLLAGGDTTRAPTLRLAELTIDDRGRRGHLQLSGQTDAFGLPRVLQVAIDGEAGGLVRTVGITVGDGAPRDRPLVMALSFDSTALGDATTMAMRIDGGLSPPPAGASTLPAVADAFALVGVLSPAAPRVDLAGNLVFAPDRVTLNALRIAAGSASVALDGAIADHGRVAIDARLALLDLDGIARLRAAMARFGPAGPGHRPMPELAIKAHIARVWLPGLGADDVDVGYSDGRSVSLGFAKAFFGTRLMASKGSVELALPLRSGSVVTGAATTPWGQLAVRYQPRDASSVTALVDAGGVLSLQMPGVAATAQIPGPGGPAVQLAATFDRASRPLLGAFGGPAARYVPDEVLRVTAQVDRAGRILEARVAGSSIDARITPVGDALVLTLAGRSRTMFAAVPSVATLLRTDEPVRARLRWRNREGVQHFDDIDAAVGDLGLTGAMQIVGERATGRLLVKAAHARTASMLVPGLIGILPAQMLDEPLLMPLDVQSDGRGFSIAARQGQVGPLSISTNLAASDDSGRMAGEITIGGPVSQAMLTNLPPWIKDVLGAKQSLSGQVELLPQRGVTIRNLKITAPGATLSGALSVPMRNGSFVWSETNGAVGGELNAVRYAAFDIPRARYDAVLGSDRKIKANIALGMRGEGSLAIRLLLDHAPDGRLGNGRIEIDARKVDLAAVCRDTGFRLFGAGLLDASLVGSVPPSIFANSSEATGLFDAVLRTASATGQLTITDGALLDIDLTARGQDKSGGVGAGERTPFTGLGGTITLGQGVLTLSGGRFATPQYALDVGGTMRVPDLTMDFVVKGQVVVVSQVSTGAAVLKAPIPPLHIVGHPSRPSYEFLAGTARITSVVGQSVRTVQKINTSVGNLQARTDKFFSERLFAPLLGKKAVASEPGTVEAPPPAARREPPPTRCGA